VKGGWASMAADLARQAGASQNPPAIDPLINTADAKADRA
jgi:hypothetical protein